MCLHKTLEPECQLCDCDYSSMCFRHWGFSLHFRGGSLTRISAFFVTMCTHTLFLVLATSTILIKTVPCHCMSTPARSAGHIDYSFRCQVTPVAVCLEFLIDEHQGLPQRNPAGCIEGLKRRPLKTPLSQTLLEAFDLDRIHNTYRQRLVGSSWIQNSLPWRRWLTLRRAWRRVATSLQLLP